MEILFRNGIHEEGEGVGYVGKLARSCEGEF